MHINMCSCYCLLNDRYTELARGATTQEKAMLSIYYYIAIYGIILAMRGSAQAKHILSNANQLMQT